MPAFLADAGKKTIDFKRLFREAAMSVMKSVSILIVAGALVGAPALAFAQAETGGAEGGAIGGGGAAGAAAGGIGVGAIAIGGAVAAAAAGAGIAAAGAGGNDSGTTTTTPATTQ